MSNYNLIFYNVFPEDVIKIIYRYNLSRKIFLDTIWDIKAINYKFPLGLYPIQYRSGGGEGHYCDLEQWVNWESYLNSIKPHKKVKRIASKRVKRSVYDLKDNRLGWRCPETGIPMSEEYKNNFDIVYHNGTRLNYAFKKSSKLNYYCAISDLRDKIYNGDGVISPSLQIGGDNKKNVCKRYKYYTMTNEDWENNGQWGDYD